MHTGWFNQFVGLCLVREGVSIVNDQNVNNFGNNNNSYQFNGDVSLVSLDLDGLASEDKLAEDVVRSEKGRRVKAGTLAAFVALVGLASLFHEAA